MELIFQNYGQMKELNATDDEKEIFKIICYCTKADDIEFVRKSDSYVSAAIGPTDVARFKFTKRAKWIRFPYVRDEKVKIETPQDVLDLADDLNKSVEIARRCNSSIK